MQLAEEIEGSIKLEVRPTPDAESYFEAVYRTENEAKLLEILKNNLGEPLKPAGMKPKFTRDVAPIVESMGSIWRDQSFYMKKEENGEYTCAALWPWQSDPSQATLKIKRGKM